jgi:hypothetical protein
MKSLRTVYLTALTLTVYAVSNVLQHKLLIFPIPANDFILLIVFGYLYFIEKNARKESLYVFFFALFSFIQNHFNFELFLSSDILQKLVDSYFFEVFQILTILAFFVNSITVYFKNKENNLSVLVLLAMIFYFASVMFKDLGYNTLQLLSFITLYAYYSILNAKQDENQRSYIFQAFWLLMTILKLSLIITLYFIS